MGIINSKGMEKRSERIDKRFTGRGALCCGRTEHFIYANRLSGSSEGAQLWTAWDERYCLHVVGADSKGGLSVRSFVSRTALRLSTHGRPWPRNMRAGGAGICAMSPREVETGSGLCCLSVWPAMSRFTTYADTCFWFKTLGDT